MSRFRNVLALLLLALAAMAAGRTHAMACEVGHCGASPQIIFARRVEQP